MKGQMYVLSKALRRKSLKDWLTNSEVICVSESLETILDYCKDKYKLHETDIENLEKWHALEDVVDGDGSICDLIIGWVGVLK